MDETRDDVDVLDTPQDSTHEMTSTQVPRHSGKIIRPPIRFIGLRETYEAISEEVEYDPYTYEEAMNDIDVLRYKFSGLNFIKPIHKIPI